MTAEFDVVIIGGGVVGCAIARELSSRFEGRYCVIEKEASVAIHASGRNSEVIHSGINQKPGSLKSRLVTRGSTMMRDYCMREKIPMEEIGTIVVARTEADRLVLRELEHRGKENGVPDVIIIDSDELKRHEPNAVGLEALISPSGAIVDSRTFVESLASDAAKKGVCFLYGTCVTDLKDIGEYIEVHGNRNSLKIKFLINCAGLYADKIAHKLGVGEDYTIIPFKGGYYKLTGANEGLVKTMIYAAPNLELPFLGIHFTKRTDQSVFLGPHSSLAFGRESYGNIDIDIKETLSFLIDTRFLKLISNREFLSIVANEIWMSLSKKAFAQEAQTLVPKLRYEHLVQMPPGIRAQLVDQNGRLVDDFVFKSTDKSYHVLNAVSPGLTSSMAFAETVVSDLVEQGILKRLQPTRRSY